MNEWVELSWVNCMMFSEHFWPFSAIKNRVTYGRTDGQTLFDASKSFKKLNPGREPAPCLEPDRSFIIWFSGLAARNYILRKNAYGTKLWVFILPLGMFWSGLLAASVKGMSDPRMMTELFRLTDEKWQWNPEQYTVMTESLTMVIGCGLYFFLFKRTSGSEKN